MQRILVPTDFSAAAEAATKVAVLLAKRANCELTLLHIKNSNTVDLLKNAGKTEDELESYLSSLCQKINFNNEITAQFKVIEGSILNDINAEAALPEYIFTVIGTHGTRGLWQTLFGADLLKIAKKSPIPVLAVPDNSILSETKNTIVFPFGGHEKFHNKTLATAALAELIEADVKLYSVKKGQAGFSQASAKNTSEAVRHFESVGVPVELVQESVEGFSIGFASQTLDFAKKEGAAVISVMATPSKELSVISATDKETLINNDDGVAILLTSDQ